MDILGYYLTTEQGEDGNYVVLSLNDDKSIPITSMGDGVPNVIGLIVDLCLAEDKIFLIEEPENDIHPKALKSLLKLIEHRSTSNQFVISTHSNIVVKYLGAAVDSKVFQVISETDYSQSVIMPKSRIVEVTNEPEKRIELLEDLGYELFDYALWKGWLFLEESSAESIINDFLIPQFADGLRNKLRTFSASGFAGIEERFENFQKVFVFVHRDSIYKDKAWVIIDAGKKEEESVNKLRQKFITWEPNHFRQFSKHDFEEYYPAEFANEIAELNNEAKYSGNNDQRKKQRREAKEKLLKQVQEWYKAFPVEAKIQFQESAGEVIDILKEIENVLA